MSFRIIVWCLVYIPTITTGFRNKFDWVEDPKKARCLTGYMTDTQPWVDEFGHLTYRNNINSSSIIVTSTNSFSAVTTLQLKVKSFKYSNGERIQYLSLSHCGLTRVPPVFKMRDHYGLSLADTIEYATFYGNNFGSIDADANMYDVSINATEATEANMDIASLRRQLTLWSVGFQGFKFSNLRELDLRACSIQAVGNRTFQRMPYLRNLYLGENQIHYVEANAFGSLSNLKHLDISRNWAFNEKGQPRDMLFETVDVLSNLNLEYLDFSFTNLGLHNIGVLNKLGPSLEMLSICYAGLNNIRSEVIMIPSLKFLDVSGNKDILNSANMFRGLKDKLQVVYAENIGLSEIDYFWNNSKLEVLKLSNNEISSVPPHVAETLTALQILDLDANRFVSWFEFMFSLMPKLKLLSLKFNNINIITKQMYQDLEKLLFISLSNNYLVCNCQARDIYEAALKNEYTKTIELITKSNSNDTRKRRLFHTGFKDFNDLIKQRKNITIFCDHGDNCDIDFDQDVTGDYLLLDYDQHINAYNCLMATEGKTITVHKLAGCAEARDLDILDNYLHDWNKFLLFIIPGLLLPIVFFVFVFRKNLRYFIIMIRNSATLSLINKKSIPEEGVIFNYDVFVSYCNEDRAWVLDQLLPHVERDCSISVCLHERDFQVGLSILENIVSCMDRSRSIMLIISKRFLLSQWCQFEMHLAQHRLLETRREDLILILLEEIPRRLRPNTLHYLMLTKTYIVWPKDETEQNLFWKRMKKSLVTHKLKHQENVSLA